MDPAKTQFIEATGKGCRACLFYRERSAVCHVAAAEAVKRGMQDCEYPNPDGKPVIYIAVEADPRQLTLLE